MKLWNKPMQNKETYMKLQEMAEGDLLTTIPIDKVIPDKNQDRQDWNSKEAIESYSELKESIKQKGIINPPIVIKIDKSDDYELVAGERRWRCAQEIGDEFITVIVKKDMADEDLSFIKLIDNEDRRNLTPYELAIAYKKRMDEFNLDAKNLAKKIGVNERKVQRLTSLLTLDIKIQAYLKDNYPVDVQIPITLQKILEKRPENFDDALLACKEKSLSRDKLISEYLNNKEAVKNKKEIADAGNGQGKQKYMRLTIEQVAWLLSKAKRMTEPYDLGDNESQFKKDLAKMLKAADRV